MSFSGHLGPMSDDDGWMDYNRKNVRHEVTRGTVKSESERNERRRECMTWFLDPTPIKTLHIEIWVTTGLRELGELGELRIIKKFIPRTRETHSGLIS